MIKMSEKTKYLLKIGLLWAILMASIGTALEAWEKDDFGIFLTWKYAVKMIIFFVVGMIVAHFNWKERQQSDNKT